ncbi:DNA-binding protein [Lutibacter profundi]|uniref:DNA-binding protein n=1 Tax=Lutibacter profundi TaxID=1622118 RepID=A0A0X8G7S9_9FLAO|nr:DUF177 domain-containing protein [Lutibacter profundi]AMC11615.1 DNA-binding protein [Lutibacter profundi]
MKDLKEFDISFIGLKEGIHQFDYIIEKKFFDFFNYEEFYNSNIKVALSFLKKTTIYELHFDFKGWVEVTCDVTNELFKYPIETSIDLIVNFGDEFNDENEELLILPYAEHKMNVAQYIYEAIILGLPLRKIHPGVNDGTLHSVVLDKLKELEIKEEKETENKKIDPRWDKLKDILIDKNTSNGTS